MDLIGFATKTRAFFSVLFTSRLVVQLRRENSQLREELLGERIDRATEADRTALQVLSDLQRARNEVATPLKMRNAELLKERDYFRGRCERLELKQEAAAEKAATPVVVAPRIHREHVPSGRKLWPAIVKERREKLIAIAKQAEADKANKKPEPAPTPQVQ